MMETKLNAGLGGIADLSIRAYAGESDLPEVARIQNAEWTADGVPERSNVDELRAWWGHPSESFDPHRDVDVVSLDGSIIAFTQREWIDANDGVREYRARCWIHPSVRRRGIGAALLARNEAVRRELAGSHVTDRPRVLGMGTPELNPGAVALAQAHGYEPVRWWADMERSLLDELPDPPALPAGLEARPGRADQARKIWEADQDAFRDHWGGWDPSDASFRRWTDSPEFQPDLMLIAWDGGEIAGAVLNAIYPDENRELGIRRGWLDSVFTRRAWRRRGLARALIVRSLHLLRERGLETAALGVDADNPSGAFGLYESAGFRPTRRFISWRKPMEAQA